MLNYDERLLVNSIEKCITSLSEKFLKWPYNFFTESDAHSYLYYYMFRSGPKELKVPYETQEPGIKTVLIHREYPTSFRYKKKGQEDLMLFKKGSRGHYDLAVLNPEFIITQDIDCIIAKDYAQWQRCCGNSAYPLLAAIEFKLIIKPLGKSIRREIKHDFQKLTWAAKQKHAKHAYMIIFNRCREELKMAYKAEKPYEDELVSFEKQYPRVKGVYLESVIKDTKKKYAGRYLNDWSRQNRLKYI